MQRQGIEPIEDNVLSKGEGFADLSLEQLPEYAGDYIFTSNWGWDNGDPNVAKPMWRRPA